MSMSGAPYNPMVVDGKTRVLHFWRRTFNDATFIEDPYYFSNLETELNVYLVRTNGVIVGQVSFPSPLKKGAIDIIYSIIIDVDHPSALEQIYVMQPDAIQPSYEI